MLLNVVPSANRLENACESRSEGSQHFAVHSIVDPESRLLTLHQPGFAKNAEVMRDGGLLDCHGAFEIADAHSAFVAREYVKQLEADRMRQEGEVLRQPLCVSLGNGRAGCAVAAAIPQFAFGEFEDFRHGYIIPTISTLVNICLQMSVSVRDGRREDAPESADERGRPTGSCRHGSPFGCVCAESCDPS